MPHIELDGQQFEVDEDGFLVDWQVWKEGIAGIMAKEDGLEAFLPGAGQIGRSKAPASQIFSTHRGRKNPVPFFF